MDYRDDTSNQDYTQWDCRLASQKPDCRQRHSNYVQRQRKVPVESVAHCPSEQESLSSDRETARRDYSDL